MSDDVGGPDRGRFLLMKSLRRCPRGWLALPDGARRCAACGAEIPVAGGRAITWALLLISLASGWAWSLRGWLADAAKPSTETGSTAPRDDVALSPRPP